MFAERHVRAIVAALDGRPAYFLSKYRELVAKELASRPKKSGGNGGVRRRDFYVTSRFVAFAGFLVLVALAAAYLVWQARILQEPPPLRIITPAQDERVTTPRVDVLGDTAPGALVTVNGQPAVVEPNGQFSLSFDVPRGLTTLTIVAQRRYGSSVSETRSVTYERTDGPFPNEDVASSTESATSSGALDQE